MSTDPISRAIAAIGTERTKPRYFAESDGGYCGSESDCPRTHYVCHTHGRLRIDCSSRKEAREVAAKLNAEIEAAGAKPRVKSVQWAYPSSDNARRFGYAHGCWCVEVGNQGEPLEAITAHSERASALLHARALGSEWDLPFRLNHPEDCEAALL